jgi:hypothetical protein
MYYLLYNIIITILICSFVEIMQRNKRLFIHSFAVYCVHILPYNAAKHVYDLTVPAFVIKQS